MQMNHQRFLAAAIFLAGTCSGLASAGTGPTPNLRTGEWEVTLNVKMQGNGFGPSMAADIAKMPPERRARMQAMMGKLANRQVSRAHRSCLTPQDLVRMTLTTFFGENEPGCKSSVVAKSAGRWEQTKTCRGDDVHTEHAVFQVADPQHVSADGVATMGESGTRTIHMTARWTGPTCRKNDD